MKDKEVYLDYLHHDTQTVVEDDTYEYLAKDSAKILNAIKRAIAFNDDGIRKIDLIFRTAEEYIEIKRWLNEQ